MSTARAIVKRLLENDDDIDPKEYVSAVGDEINAKVKADLDAGNITADTIRAWGLAAGDYIYSRRIFSSDGRPASAKVTSVQLWQTRPNDFKIKWKYGMYQYGDITPYNANQFSLKPGPTQQEIADKKAEKLNGKRQDVYNRDEPALGESRK